MRVTSIGAMAMVAVALDSTFPVYLRGRPDECKPDASPGKSDRRRSDGKNWSKKMSARIIALALVVLMLLSVSSAALAEAKGRPDTPPDKEQRPETPPGHANRPEQTPSGTVPATPATPAEPHPGEGPATPATPATPAQPGHSDKDDDSNPTDDQGPLGYSVYPSYVWWSLTRYPTGAYNNLYPGCENVSGSWPFTITAWETNYTSIDLYFAATDFYSWYGRYSFSITNLWVDDDSCINETVESGNDPYQMQNTYSSEPYFSNIAPGESVNLYCYLSFPNDQYITSYWAWLFIKAVPSGT